MTKTVVITGAARGLGLELARAHRLLGDNVIGGCRNPTHAEELLAVGATVASLDMADADSIDAFARTVDASPVHVLYNSAGVDTRAFGADDSTRGALTIDGDRFDAVMRVNVTGPLLLVRALHHSLKAGSGTVVNVSSQIGSIEIAQKMGKDVAYAASKAALNMVTLKQSQALHADGIAVIALHPGWLRTEMGGEAADLDPADAARQIAETVGTLTISDTGRFIRWNGTSHPW